MSSSKPSRRSTQGAPPAADHAGEPFGWTARSKTTHARTRRASGRPHPFSDPRHQLAWGIFCIVGAAIVLLAYVTRPVDHTARTVTGLILLAFLAASGGFLIFAALVRIRWRKQQGIPTGRG